jgi:hypothetical protein
MLILTYSRIADVRRYQESVASCKAAVAFVLKHPDIDSAYVADHGGAFPKLIMDWNQIQTAMRETHCPKYGTAYGEGYICAECEREHDNYRMLVNLEMSKHQYQLWFVIDKRVIFKCPVDNFDNAKILFNSLNTGNVSGVRIARHDPTEGCESVLHKFN